MAYQTGKPPVTQPAKGDAPNTGAPGPTPAPVKTYANPDLEQLRVFKPGYGTNNDNSPSSVPQGHKQTSALADELKRVNAQGDGGDALQDIIEQGVHMDVGFQMRAISDKNVPTHPAQAKRAADSGSPGGTVPAQCGAAAMAAPKDPYAS